MLILHKKQKTFFFKFGLFFCAYGPLNVLFGLLECCVGECSDDNDAGFSLSVYVSCLHCWAHGVIKVSVNSDRETHSV